MKQARTLFTLFVLAILVLATGQGAHTQIQPPSSFPFPKPSSVSGIVRLEGLSRTAVAQPVTFELTPFQIVPFPQVSKSKMTLTLWIRAEGRCSFQIPAGLYILRIKGAKWLSETEILDARTPWATFETTLLGGDLNNDNCVDKADREIVYSTLFAKSQSGKFEWEDRADSNCDGAIDKRDLQVVEWNLGQIGQ
jgi:hypothetical protein